MWWKYNISTCSTKVLHTCTSVEVRKNSTGPVSCTNTGTGTGMICTKIKVILKILEFNFLKSTGYRDRVPYHGSDLFTCPGTINTATCMIL